MFFNNMFYFMFASSYDVHILKFFILRSWYGVLQPKISRNNEPMEVIPITEDCR